VLEAVEFPAGITGLDAALADVDGDYFTHVGGGCWSLEVTFMSIPTDFSPSFQRALAGQRHLYKKVNGPARKKDPEEQVAAEPRR
jgi:hypothetical protein